MYLHFFPNFWLIIQSTICLKILSYYLPRMDIVKGNWLEILDEHVHEDLRKHRTYKGHSVRDLLRALRNKKHHYNELPDVTKLMYGRIPDQYCVYWTSRFPQLVTHSWMAMHQIKNEPNLTKYFDKDYDFVKVRCLYFKNLIYSLKRIHMLLLYYWLFF